MHVIFYLTSKPARTILPSQIIIVKLNYYHLFHFTLVNMQGFIVYVLVLYFISPCLCIRFNVVTTSGTTYNVMQYGATGDGKSDDTNVYVFIFYLYNFNLYILHIIL